MSAGAESFASLADEAHAYLTTIGRRSRTPHEIEIWWAYHAGRVYMISGGGDSSDWVRNLQADPSARIRVAATTVEMRARFELDLEERVTAGWMLAAKYRPGDASWSKGFLVAFDAAPG